MTTITHVAVKYKGTVYSLPPPNRHHHILRQIAPIEGAHSEGFLVDNETYVNRKTAYKIAKENGQLNRIVSPNHYNGTELYSEDLW